MNFSLFTIPIFLLLVAIIPSSFSQDSSVTDNGFFGVEQDSYILKYGDEFQIVKISGIGDVPQGVDRAKVVIIILIQIQHKILIEQFLVPMVILN